MSADSLTRSGEARSHVGICPKEKIEERRKKAVFSNQLAERRSRTQLSKKMTDNQQLTTDNFDKKNPRISSEV
jgi:hypothetical protein